MTIVLNSSSTFQNYTVSSIIDGTLRLIGVKNQDRDVDPVEYGDALTALNMMLDSWSNENLLLNQLVRETFATTPGKQIHTWGVGGDFNSSRPTEILSASDTIGTIDFPLKIVQYDDYETIGLKTFSTVHSRLVYIDDAYPLRNVRLYPVPSGQSVNFESLKPLTNFNNFTDLVNLPPGYARAFKYNLAIEIAPEYQMALSSDIGKIAEESKNAIRKSNHRPVTMTVDRGLFTPRGGRYDPFSDSVY